MKASYLFILVIALASCGGKKDSVQKEELVISQEEQAFFKATEKDTVRIANDSIAYEITIIEPGFYGWLQSIAHPRGYYSQSYMESRNNIFVMNWNIRATQPTVYNPDLYIMPINYERGIDYGYEVNYQLYNYFLFFQRKYNQRLGPFLPRIN